MSLSNGESDPKRNVMNNATEDWCAHCESIKILSLVAMRIKKSHGQSSNPNHTSGGIN